jgi:hypothetical protein
MGPYSSYKTKPTAPPTFFALLKRPSITPHRFVRDRHNFFMSSQTRQNRRSSRLQDLLLGNVEEDGGWGNGVQRVVLYFANSDIEGCALSALPTYYQRQEGYCCV